MTSTGLCRYDLDWSPPRDGPPSPVPESEGGSPRRQRKAMESFVGDVWSTAPRHVTRDAPPLPAGARNMTTIMNHELRRKVAELERTLAEVRGREKTRAIGRIRSSCMSAAWAAWRWRVYGAPALKAAARRLVGRLQHAKVAAAIKRWAEFYGTQRMLRRLGLRLRNFGLSRSFASWVAGMEIGRAEREKRVEVRIKIMCRGPATVAT